MFKHMYSFTFGIMLLAATASVQAAPSDVDDLVGARASSGESALEDRGYRHVKNLRVSDSIIGYWWNSRRQACIAVTTSDGRYKTIFEQPESMCDEDGGGSYGHESGGSEAPPGGFGSSTPEIRRVDNGNIAVDMGGCNVLFSDRGDIVNAGRSCSNRQVDEARDAYEGYMREQGGGGYGYDNDRYGSRNEHVTLYRDTEYRGTSIDLYDGDDVSDLGDTHIGNDELSSIRIPRGCAVVLYRDTGYRGQSLELNSDERELGRTRIGNDEASSIEVSCR